MKCTNSLHCSKLSILFQIFWRMLSTHELLIEKQTFKLFCLVQVLPIRVICRFSFRYSVCWFFSMYFIVKNFCFFECWLLCSIQFLMGIKMCAHWWVSNECESPLVLFNYVWVIKACVHWWISNIESLLVDIKAMWCPLPDGANTFRVWNSEVLHLKHFVMEVEKLLCRPIT